MLRYPQNGVINTIESFDALRTSDVLGEKCTSIWRTAGAPTLRNGDRKAACKNRSDPGRPRHRLRKSPCAPGDSRSSVRGKKMCCRVCRIWVACACGRRGLSFGATWVAGAGRWRWSAIERADDAEGAAIDDVLNQAFDGLFGQVSKQRNFL